jgi:5-hydroxyisourate hydrolase-like protein (transthyretin family)
MIASLLLAALLLQAPSSGSISGVVSNAMTGQPAANVQVTLIRTDIVPAASIDNPFRYTRASSLVTFPGEWWSQIARKAATDAVAAAGLSVSDIRQIHIRPDRTAWIALSDPNTTDGQGRFVFNDVRPGFYALLVNGSGYALQEYRERPASTATRIRVTSGESVNLQLRIAPAGAVSGRALDEAGQPVSDVIVQVIRHGYDASGLKKLQVIGSTHTNDRGEYRLFRVPPGRYFLRAGSSYGEFTPSSSRLAAVAAQAVIQDSFTTIFYPGALDIEAASRIEVPPGGEVDRIDFSLRRLSNVRIRGRVVDLTTRRPPENLLIELNSGSSIASTEEVSEPLSNIAGYNKSDGSFEFEHVSPGSYAVTIGERNTTLAVLGPVVVSSSDKDLGELIVGESNTIQVKSRMESGKPTPAAFSWNQIRLQLRHNSIDFRPVRTDLNQEAELYNNGELRLRNVIQGDYRLFLTNLPEGFYLKEARVGDSDALKDVIHIASGKTETLEIVLGTTRSVIEGVAVDTQGQPVSGAQVVLVPARRQRTDLFKAITAMSDGRFKLLNVPPGNYKLFAWETIESNGYFDPELLGQAEAQGVPVRVGESSSHMLQVILSKPQ